MGVLPLPIIFDLPENTTLHTEKNAQDLRFGITTWTQRLPYHKIRTKEQTIRRGNPSRNQSLGVSNFTKRVELLIDF